MVIRKLIVGAAVALLFAGAAQAQTSVVIRKSDGSGPVTADANGLEVQGAGTAGAPAGGVVTVQGVASGTAVRVDCVTGCSGGGGGGSTTMTATAAAPSYTEGSTSNPLSSNLTGDLRVIAKQNGTWSVNLGTIGTAATAANQTATQGTFGAQTANKTVIYDGTGALVDWSAPVPINLASATTGGSTKYGYQSAASTNSTLVASGARTFHHVTLINTTASLYYLRMYDAAAAPTCSSGTNFAYSIPIPASTTGSGVQISFGPFGQAFTNGLAFCLTGGGSSTDNTNAAVGVFAIMSYK